MKIVQYPHPILTYVSKPLQKIDAKIREIVAEMFDLMYRADGVGLAANQVELPYRLVVLNPTADPEKKEEEFVLINPVITKRSSKLIEIEEGCLSYPDLRLHVVRPTEVTVQAVNLSGQPVRYRWKGILARIAQHEIDHLEGIGFYQRTEETEELFAQKLLRKFIDQFAAEQKSGESPSDEEIARRITQWESERT